MFACWKKKVEVFCDSEFWHGFNFSETTDRIGTNQKYWRSKIKRNMERDKEVNESLQNDGWLVLRFWEKEILSQTEFCVNKIEEALKARGEKNEQQK